MEISYRTAAEDDIEAVNLLVMQAITEMEKKNIMQWDELYPTKEDFLEDISKQQLSVGCINNQIVVVFTLNQDYDGEYMNGNWKNPEKSFMVLHRLCVHPQFQNRGIAKSTMDYIEKQTLSQGKEAVRLDVYSRNPYAVQLYIGCGYQKVGTAEWRKGIFYLMEKYLE